MIATPLLMLMLLLVVQFGVWLHAVHTAQATAAHALAAARAYGAGPAEGQAQADALLGQVSGGALVQAQASVTQQGDLVQAAVDGQAQTVVPLLSLPVHVQASGPLEEWVTP